MKLSQWQNLGLPVALGICAAFLNWMAVSRKLEPRFYAAAKNEVAPGKKIQLVDLTKVTISYDSTSNLNQTLVPWDKVNALVGSYAQRRIPAGCLLTQHDLPEANVASKAIDEELIKLTLTKSDRMVLPVFVNDKVDLRYKGRVVIAEGRVLSVSRGNEEAGKDETYSFCIGVKAAQYQAYESLSDSMKSQLKLAEHIQNKEINH